MVVMMMCHMVRVYLMAAYKYPREMSWLTGVALLGLTVSMAFTGQLLRWDDVGVWSTYVAAEQMGYLDFFAARGISEDQGRQCLADTAKLEEQANFTQRYGSEFDITGTPTFKLNGRDVDANTWAGLEPILQRAGAR